MNKLTKYDISYVDNPQTFVGRDYILWILPLNKAIPKQVVLTDNVNKDDTEIKIVSSLDEFIINEGDLLNFNGKFIIIKETTKILTTETIVKIENSAFDIAVDSFSVTFGLIPVLADSNSSFDTSSTIAKTINEDTSYYGYSAVTSRSLTVNFEGVMLASDRLNYIMDKRQLYYFEFRNPIYQENRRGTYRGIAEGIISMIDNDFVKFKGELLSNSNLDDWNPEIEENPGYCPYLPSYKINYNLMATEDQIQYCSLDSSDLYIIN